MNDQTEKNETGQAEWTLSNILAIAGFVVLVILLAWLAIQFVRLVPTAWNRLANVFDENQRALEERTANNDVVSDDDSNDVATDDNVIVTDNSEDYIDTDEVTGGDQNDSKDTATTTTPTTGTGTVKPTPTQYRTVATYVVPTSDPNGYTDLEVIFVAVGRMTGDERFVSGAALETDEVGAIQFRVRNIGTKTSTDWRFETLLTSGDTMKSSVQSPLKPGEMTTLTVVFDTGSKDGNRSFGVAVYGGNDINATNNGFRSSTHVR